MNEPFVCNKPTCTTLLKNEKGFYFETLAGGYIARKENNFDYLKCYYWLDEDELNEINPVRK
jgi:hypothetical protein